jgi:hypothetical protein
MMTKIFTNRNFMRKLSSCLLLAATTCSLYADKAIHDEPYAGCEKHHDCDLFNRGKRVWFANAELLYWTVDESATDFALKMNHASWSPTENTYAMGKYKNAKFGWAPGVRASIGYFYAQHYWDAYAQYTYFSVGGCDEEDPPKEPDRFLNGTWPHPDALAGGPVPSPLQKATSHINFNYHVFDLIASRRYHTNPHLRVNLLGGVTSAWIHQNWKIRYLNTLNQRTKIRNKWGFSGAGLRIGVLVDWFVGMDFFLTGSTSSALLAGCYSNSAKQTSSVTVPNARSNVIRNTQFHDGRMTYNAQFLAGPSWQKNFGSNRVGVFVFYEFNMWTNLHRVFRSTQAAPRVAHETWADDSIIGLQGLTLKVNVDF